VDAKISKKFDEAKNTVKELSLDYRKIHACPNDCILYWKEHEGAQFYPVCKASRWKSESEKIPAKVLRHFPLN